MTDLAVTAASCVPGTNSKQEVGVAGESLAAGKGVYKSSSTGKWMLADSNSATAEARTPTAIALTGSALNQPVVVHKKGQLTLGATLVANTPYFASDTPGGICPIADVGTGEYLTQIGIAISTTVLDVLFHSTGVAN
jgi:hypothetical protein